MPDNVILVGFMGAGKSVCGRLLARRLGRCFVEEAFRRLEAEALEALRLKSGDVVATGGGLPCRQGRMEALRALGTVVWLRGEVEELLARARRGGQRPMLEGRTPADLDALYRERQPYYARAHLTVDTAGLGVDQVVARILAALRGTHAARV